METGDRLTSVENKQKVQLPIRRTESILPWFRPNYLNTFCFFGWNMVITVGPPTEPTTELPAEPPAELGAKPAVEPYTKNIILEEIAPNEFRQQGQFWQKNVRLRSDFAYARIDNPIIETDYERLLFRLLEHPLAYQIATREQGRWIRGYADSITDSEVRELARLAARDYRKYNYLEMRLRRPSARWQQEALLEFVEYQGKIISNDITIHYSLQKMFEVRIGRQSWVNMQGVWKP